MNQMLLRVISAYNETYAYYAKRRLSACPLI